MVALARTPPVEPGASQASRPNTQRRVEIVHESLLSEWPRLVRWQTQDQEGAQLRDELRQAARMWEQHERSEDLLWTGTAFREFQLWRERYPGRLTELEESFGDSMTRHALRRRRRRRFAVTAAFAFLLLVLAVVGIFWRDSVGAARRAEASKLLAFGQLEIDQYPTQALAYATKSLELADLPEVRLFALRALGKGPPAMILPAEPRLDRTLSRARFSPSGDWLSLEGGRDLAVISRDGRTFHHLGSFPSTPGLVGSCFTPGGERLLATKGGQLGIWTMPGFEAELRREIPTPGVEVSFDLWCTPSGYFVIGFAGSDRLVTRLSLAGDPEATRRVGGGAIPHVDAEGRRIAFAGDGGRTLVVQPFDDPEAPIRVVGRHDSAIDQVRFHPAGHLVAASDRGDQVLIWSLDSTDVAPRRALSGARGKGLEFGQDGDWLATWTKTADGYLAEVWDLRHPTSATPLRILSPGPSGDEDPAFSPDGRWLTTNHVGGRALWALSHEYPIVLPIPESGPYGRDVAFTPDGDGLVSTAAGEIRLWDLAPGGRVRALASDLGSLRNLSIDPRGRFVVVAWGDEILVVPLDGGPIRSLNGATQFNWQVSVDAEGRRAVTASGRGAPDIKVIRIWDLETGEMTTLGPTPEMGEGRTGAQSDFAFLPDGRLATVGDGGLRVWNVADNTSTVIAPCSPESLLVTFGGGRFAAYTQEDDVVAITDLAEGTTRRVSTHSGVWPIAVDERGTVLVSGGLDGIVRVGPISGQEPHLLIGHQGMVRAVAISPDRERIASIGEDHTIRIWPMPDLAEPPLHTLEHGALLAKLHSLTNLRVIEDPGSSSGWKLDLDPFPGWEEVPEW